MVLQPTKTRAKPSVIWKYYIVKENHVECKACGKILKGIRTTNAETHLSYVHPEIYQVFLGLKHKALQEKRNQFFNVCNVFPVDKF